MSEQPLLADLFAMPSPSDVTLQCTNLRSLDGKRPVFVDHTESVFFFPYLHVRFLEIPPASVAAEGESGERAGSPATGPDQADDLELNFELDEEFLRRVREA